MSGRRSFPTYHSMKGGPLPPFDEPPFPGGRGPPPPHHPHLLDDLRDVGPPLPFAGGHRGGTGPLPPHAHQAAMIEERFAASHQDIQVLLVDNQGLAATHVALKQELAAAQQQLQQAFHAARTAEAQGEAQSEQPLSIPHVGRTEQSSSEAKDDGKSSEMIASKKKGGTEQSSTEAKDDGKSSEMIASKKKECNYAKGKWVADRRRPLYSGFGCKQWLSQMWSCRENKRKDFAYENYRWQPKDCEMPEFEGPKFLTRMRHKTIAFVGDSLGRQQFQSMMCMVTGGREYPEVEDIGRQYGLIIPPGAKRPDGWAYRFPRTNTTILYYWSASLCELEPINRTDPATSFAMHLDRPAFFLQQYLHRFDVLVLNTGHHWNRGKITGNRWVMYVDGKPNADKKIAAVGNAKNLTVHSVAKWVDLQLPQHPRLKAFFRTMSPRHFANGDWNTGGSCDNTTPLAGGSEVTKDGSDDPVVADAVKGTRVKLLDITAISQLRDEGHVSHYSIRTQTGMSDCLHWCLPGIPDSWNELLAAQV